MNDKEKKLNIFFVNIFNQILAWEESTVRLSGLKDLSVKELHIIEAASILCEDDCQTMGNIAARLQITVGALTTAVNTLVSKGYLCRGGDSGDRRKVYIFLTEEGKTALKKHEEFHRNMIQDIVKMLDDNSFDNLIGSLDMLSGYFKNLK